jgi:predicted peptidase
MAMPRWLPAVVLLAVPACADPPPAGTGFVNRVHTDADGESKYVLFVPRDYQTAGAAPVILFLHGANATGTDGLSPAKGALAEVVRAKQATFGFFVVFPQAGHEEVPIPERWSPDKPDGKRALAILAEVEREFGTDPKRVYVTGLSMGGYGTWAMAAKHPERWAAAVPICGGGDPAWAGKLKSVPIWCFHGDADTIIPVGQSREMIAAVRAAGGTPTYTEYPGVAHACWDRAYGTPGLFDWFLEHRGQ